MAVREKITTYFQAFNVVLGMEINDKIKRAIADLEAEGHAERNICFAIWRTQDKLLAFKRDNRFISILKNEVNKWSWKNADPRWKEYWNKKNEEKKAAAIRKEIDAVIESEKAIEHLNKVVDATYKRPKKMKGYIYFIQGQCGGAIKIGYSLDPVSRLKGLQTGYPDTLVILAMIPGNESIEKGLHKEFDSSRLNGEWFRPDTRLIDKIKELKARVKQV